MSPIATRAPCRISAAAVARPIPRAPPVIATTFPASDVDLLTLALPPVIRFDGADTVSLAAPPALFGWPAKQRRSVREVNKLHGRPMSYFTHDGLQLAYTVHGDGDDMMAVPSGPAAVAEDADAAGTTAGPEGNRVVTLDPPGTATPTARRRCGATR